MAKAEKVKILSAERKRLFDQGISEYRADLLKYLEGIPQEELPAVRAQLKKTIEEIGAKWAAEDAEQRARKPRIIPFRERARVELKDDALKP